jgi:hypothetical protein
MVSRHHVQPRASAAVAPCGQAISGHGARVSDDDVPGLPGPYGR